MTYEQHCQKTDELLRALVVAAQKDDKLFAALTVVELFNHVKSAPPPPRELH